MPLRRTLQCSKLQAKASTLALSTDSGGRPIKQYELCSVHADQVAQLEKLKGTGDREAQGRGVSNRDNKAAAAEFRELVGMEFDEFTHQAPAKVLVALSKFAEPVDITVLRLAGESHPLFQQQQDRLVRALRPRGSARTRTRPNGDL